MKRPLFFIASILLLKIKLWGLRNPKINKLCMGFKKSEFKKPGFNKNEKKKPKTQRPHRATHSHREFNSGKAERTSSSGNQKKKSGV
jgi:hypothetical protein